MAAIDTAPLENSLGFLALGAYILTLMPTNLRIIFPQSKQASLPKWLLKYRRIIGILAFCLALLHGFLLVKKRDIDFLDPNTYWIYIQGISTFIIFTLLAITSNNWSIKRLKKNWKRLHTLTYLAIFLLIWHVWDKMSEHWTYLTPIALVGMVTTTLLFLMRRWIEHRNKQQKAKEKVSPSQIPEELLVSDTGEQLVPVRLFSQANKEYPVMRSKQITWKYSAALGISTLMMLVGSKSFASLFSLSRNASIATISVPTTQPLRTLQGNSTWLYAIAISPDGRFLASGSYDKQIKIWDLSSNTLLYTLKGHGDAIVSLAISPDSKLLASGSWDNRIKLWNLETGQLLRTLDAHTDDVEAVAISPNGKWLASGSADKTIRIWNVQTGAQVHKFSDGDWVRTVAFSADGQTLASGNEGGTLKIWRLRDGVVLETLNAHSQALRSVAFSPDGRALASGSADGTVKLWQMPTGQLLHSLPGHSGVVWSVAFSPDGKRLASGSYDRTIKLWRLPDGKLLENLTGHEQAVRSVAFSPHGDMIASSSADKTIRIWSLPKERELSSRFLVLKHSTKITAYYASN